MSVLASPPSEFALANSFKRIPVNTLFQVGVERTKAGVDAWQLERATRRAETAR